MSSDAESDRALDGALADLVGASEPSDYDVNGFHFRHTADAANLSAIARAFVERDYFLEMMTCEDRQELFNGFHVSPGKSVSSVSKMSATPPRQP